MALGEAASLALTVTLPLPALTAASAVEDALAVAVAVGAGLEVFCAPQALRPSAAIAAMDSAAAPVRRRWLVGGAEVR